MIYLDNAATTKIDESVKARIIDIFDNHYGNPSSSHRFGLQSEKIVNASRSLIAKNIKAKDEEIYFTSGGTESNNIAILGVRNANKNKNHIITSCIEHPSVLSVFKVLEQEGYEVTYLKVDQMGRINLDELKASVKESTLLVSIMYVNNEIGVINDIEAISKIVKGINKDSYIHVDAIQAFGKLKINVRKLGIDLLSISGHKFHSPKGIGCLYVKKGTKIKSLVYGGNQEGQLRSGTENLSGVAAIAEATDIQYGDFENIVSNNHILKSRMIEILSAGIEGLVVNSPINSNYSDHILSISIPGIKGEVLLHDLEAKEIYISTGSACSSNKKKQFSHVLEAMGMDEILMDGTIRLSFSKFNSLRDIEEGGQAIIDSVKRLRKIMKLSR